METEMILNEMERRLIELLRALPEEQATRVIAFAEQLKHDADVMAIVHRSLRDHADVWAELAKR